MTEHAALFELPATAPPRPPVAASLAAPLYESRWATIYHGRSEHILPSLPTESVDLVVTDPPYGNAHQSNRRQDRFDRIDGDGANDRDMIRTVLEQCVRVVGQHRHLYAFGPRDVMAGLKVADPTELVWDKGSMGSGDVTAPWGPAHEPITFTVSKHRHAGEAGRPTLPTRIRKGTVLRYPRLAGRALRHPHQKPVPLMRELIESSSRQGELVLDAFAGSGSTGVAAILCGRRVVLIESVRGHADLCVERVREAERLIEAMGAV